ncbi:selenocysteine insertion sequence-binding protein 2-like isoform X2 [Notolabrus celidotus]|uniref:selenocysteine insertion sequence-binding protein 2-like isoform X2 n=1 Tax=Notolabrus celidotus TaxID=1203425 RepID=UPI00148F5495|nr:selenocysteine insertion sequence-binding protein 2-like isoform X2 [Notolabrus celidotus]
MDKERKLTSAVQKHPRGERKESAEPHTASSTHLVLPNPYVSLQSLRGNQSGVSLKQSPSNTNGVPSGGGGDVSRSHGYSSSRRVRESREDFQQRDRPVRDPQASKSNNDSPAQGRHMGKNQLDAQRRGFRGARSAPNSAGKSKPAQAALTPFEVKMTDFPELSGVPLGKAGPPLVQKECWGPLSQRSASSWEFDRRSAPTLPDPKKTDSNVQPDSSAASSDQPVVSSWANIASQPPKKPAPVEKTISSNNMQMEENAAEQEDEAPGKKKRRKKKKKAKGGEDEEAEIEVTAVHQEPPKFEDEEEFPGLNVTFTGTNKLLWGNNEAKLCNEENQRECFQHQLAEPNKEKSPAAKTAPSESTKKAQKAEKGSGKKSKAPVQLDIGNMLAALEKKQQSQKAKQDAKPVILSVGGGLPVVQKQPVVQKKTPWQQDKIAHNPLDSTSPLVKKGKQREVPKAKKPTPLKKIILKEREERKQRRLLDEMGLLPEDDVKPADEAAEDEQFDTNATDEVGSPTEEPDEDQTEVNGTQEMAKECEEELDKEETAEEESTSPVALPASRPKIHSRKFRDYCSQMLSKDLDKCVTDLLKELVRFQDRLYQKDPMKARMKRRIVMGLREVLKHLKLRKVKCVVISPNCERIQSKGGLDEALYTIIDSCREQGVPFVFALSRKALGRCVNKAVPVSLVGIFNYDGAQDFYHKMIELSSEARTAYEVMATSLEETGEAEVEETKNSEGELQISNLTEEAEPGADTTKSEEPDYIKTWKKMLEKDYNHKLLNFEEQFNSMHLDSDCTDIFDEDETS